MAIRHGQFGPDRTGNDAIAPEEAGIEALLREVGARLEPSEAMRHEVYAAVQAEWRALVEDLRRQRRANSRSRALRWVAGLACLALITLIGVRFMAPATPLQVATVLRIDGHLLVASGNDRHPIAPQQSVMVGQTLQTDARSRAALTYAGHISMRLDRNTIVKLAATDRLLLSCGALYIDSPPAATATPALTVQTHAGSVRHVGTQYLVRTHADQIEVSVREGRVIIAGAGGESLGAAGEKLRVTTQGEVTRTALAPHDAQWQWVVSLAPSFDITDRPLVQLLDWVARETGRKIVYGSAQAQIAAQEIILRGSVAGLDPQTALNAVLATTQLRRYETANADSIGIALAPADTTPRTP